MGDDNTSDEEFASEEMPEAVVWPLSDVLDLHTVPPRDVAMVVREWLQAAQLEGWPVGRVIHGKGIGVQRAMVRKILGETPWVLSITDGGEGSGGWGATLVRFAKL